MARARPQGKSMFYLKSLPGHVQMPGWAHRPGLRDLGRWLALCPEERRAVTEAAIVLLTVHSLLLMPARFWSRLLEQACGFCPPGQHDPDRKAEVELVVRAVARVGSRLPRTTCLGRALAAWLMLRRRKIPSLVSLGVAAEPGAPFRAHAWLSWSGRAVLGAPLPGQYVPLGRVEPGAAFDRSSGPAGPS